MKRSWRRHSAAGRKARRRAAGYAAWRAGPFLSFARPLACASHNTYCAPFGRARAHNCHSISQHPPASAPACLLARLSGGPLRSAPCDRPVICGRPRMRLLLRVACRFARRTLRLPPAAASPWWARLAQRGGGGCCLCGPGPIFPCPCWRLGRPRRIFGQCPSLVNGLVKVWVDPERDPINTPATVPTYAYTYTHYSLNPLRHSQWYVAARGRPPIHTRARAHTPPPF